MIDRYYLMLGKACNLKCIYCHQGQEKPLGKDTEVAPRTIAEYFPEYGEYSVVFYGGEPLLYLDYVLAIARELKNRNPKAILRTITNGTLLTVETAKRLNELDFWVGVSHDGYAFEATRGAKDFLKHNPEPFLALKQRSISATITTQNPDFYDVWDYFEDFSRKNAIEKENVYIGIACDVDGTTDTRLLLQDNPAFEKMLDKTFANLEVAIKANNPTAYEYLQYLPMIRTLLSRIQNPSNKGAWCGVDKRVCNIDTHGNLYPCHNMETPNGHISEGGLKPGSYNPYINTEKCRSCIASIFCGGGCVACSSKAHEASCYVQYQQFVRLIALVQRLQKEGWENDCIKM